MREIQRNAPLGPFLVKVLRETSGELVEELDRIGERDAGRAPAGEWSFAQIAAHLARAEQMYLDYTERLLSRRQPVLEPVDLYVTEDDLKGSGGYRRDLYRYSELRMELVYYLWDAPPSAW